VVGGGETITALNLTGMRNHVDVVSTGGGAMLEFLSGKKLPGVEAVTKRWWL
jgi:phosphoglycerate kinase